MKSYTAILGVLPALLLAVLLSLAGTTLHAQRFPRQLENIQMFGQGETIQFVFSQPYEGSPVVEHKAGSFSLRFSGTGSTKPVRALRPVDESIYREIKVVENQFATTVSFEFKNAALTVKNRLAFNTDKNVLKVTLDAPGAPPQASAQGRATQELLREMENRIAGEPGGSRPDGAAGSMGAAATAGAADSAASGSLALGDREFFYSLVTMVIALVIIVGLLYGLLYLYNRFLAVRLRRFAGTHSIRQVATFHIGPRQRIVVLEINDEVIACGVTPSQITYLTHMGGKGPVGHKAGAPAGGPGSIGPGSGEPTAGAKSASARSTETQAARTDPVQQFAEVLKQKVRSLKRIN